MPTKESSIDELLEAARRGDRQALGELLDVCRVYLRGMAHERLSTVLGKRIGASDLIQETLLEAHRDFARFHGETKPEFFRWIAQILEHNALGAARDHAAQKRSVHRERSLDELHAVGDSGHDVFAASQSTPSGHLMKAEDAIRLTTALETLPDSQREAVRLRHLYGWPLARIAKHLGRTETATAGLVKRGVLALRQRLSSHER